MPIDPAEKVIICAEKVIAVIKGTKKGEGRHREAWYTAMVAIMEAFLNSEH